MHVIGTAGHVDHGKSSLVRALTGTDPDRWLEEKLRGMTLDLGFARLRFSDGSDAAIVDVPGHERFVHNMLAGAAGVELLMLVVAANEGPQPQTFEHLAILRYLNVKRTVVVLTKSDLLDEDELAYARESVTQALADTFAASAPIVAVSTVTGSGLDELRAILHATIGALPPRPVDAPAYLPIDRVFALDGHGTIVTGTLMQGRVAVGDRLAASGIDREVRVRGLHVFGEKRETVEAGARVALNLVNVERSDLARGAVIASGQFETHASLAVNFIVEPSARSILRRRTPVRAYVGSAEILGTLVFERVPNAGDESLPATLHLRTPTVIVPGAAFVVRRLSPKTLLGGGTFAGAILADDRDRAQDAADAALDLPDDDPDVRALLAALERQGVAGATSARLGAIANIREESAEAILQTLVVHDRAYALERPAAYAARAAIDELVALASAHLSASEGETPWRTGTTSIALSRALARPEAEVVRALAPAVRAGRIALRAGYYATPDFAPALSRDQRTFFETLFVRDPNATHVPVPLADVVARMKAAKIDGLSAAFDMLVATGVLHKVHDAVYRDDQIAFLRGALVTALQERKTITPSEYRDLVGSSRKYVVPLLEWFDATGVTLRSGDARVLRVGRARTQ
jgi:selenocysteine-specific elongation factor